MAASLTGVDAESSLRDGSESPASTTNCSPAEESKALPVYPGLAGLPEELLELILCNDALDYRDIASVSSVCKRLRALCATRKKVWRKQMFTRWSSTVKYYKHMDPLDWMEEYKTRHRAGIAAHKLVYSFTKELIMEHHLPCEGSFDLETLAYPAHFIEDELMCILGNKSWRFFIQKYCAKKILYYMRQEYTMSKFKEFLERPADQQDILEGAVLIDRYCNPLADVSYANIQDQIEDILEKVKAYLSKKNSKHPSLSLQPGASTIEDIGLQGQALDALNHVLFVDMKFKGNAADFYNPLNSYMHQVLITKTGIPISLSVLYLTLAQRLGVFLEPVNFPNHFMLRWCQSTQRSSCITDYIYVDAFGSGKYLTAKECEYMIGQPVTQEVYAAVNTKEVMQRMVGNLLNLGKRESKDRSFMLLRVSLDLYLTMYPDSVQHLLLQARLYFHLGIWPEKVLDILQNIQALDPSQHGAVAYLVQHTLEHIERRKEESAHHAKLRSNEKEVRYSVGLIMRHRRYGYSCVIFGWDPLYMMPPDWMENLELYYLSKGTTQPFYSVLVDDRTCNYVAQEDLEPHPSPAEISHPDITLFFSEFAGTHYVTNKELLLQYPEDADFIVQQSEEGLSDSSPQES